jgi:hypothetical protein
MAPDQLVEYQQEVAHQRTDRTFLYGIAGSGKTTAGIERVRYLLEQSVPAHEILVFVPQRTLGLPYDRFLSSSELPAGAEVRIATIGSIGHELVDLFWVAVAEEAGFRQPDQRPRFLSLETAQYYMAQIVAPLISVRGYFDTVTIDRNRLYSQILDNLGKAAVVGFPHTEIGERLKAAWIGEESQRRVYDEVQICASAFRAFCLEHNLVDFSLQTELLAERIWQMPQAQKVFTDRYRHIIIDNIEEDSPVTHDLLLNWLPETESALVIYDTQASYRSFLGADDESALRLSELCENRVQFDQSFVMNDSVIDLSNVLSSSLLRQQPSAEDNDLRDVLSVDTSSRYYTETLYWTVEEIARLVNDEGAEPGEIVVLAPYLSDALRFTISYQLEARGIPVRSHRPSRSLREEPQAQALMTLAKLSHPDWRLFPTAFDVAQALMTCISNLDWVRAQLLTQKLYHQFGGVLNPFDEAQSDMQERITYSVGERYDRLRVWIKEYIESAELLPLDHFWSKLFGEILSQPGFGFHDMPAYEEIAANLVDSARKFRQTIDVLPEFKTHAQAFVETVEGGILADQYFRSWELDESNAVLIAPAYTFVLQNTPTDYQFWLNIGGRGWTERLYQPLTHAQILTREWPMGRLWTDEDEVQANIESLEHLLVGLVRRCRKHIYLGYSELGEQGSEQRSILLDAVQRILRRRLGVQTDQVDQDSQTSESE